MMTATELYMRSNNITDIKDIDRMLPGEGITLKNGMNLYFNIDKGDDENGIYFVIYPSKKFRNYFACETYLQLKSMQDLSQFLELTLDVNFKTNTDPHLLRLVVLDDPPFESVKVEFSMHDTVYLVFDMVGFFEIRIEMTSREVKKFKKLTKIN